jgi:hypothetical protein
MNIFTGSIEIQMLCWSVVLGLGQLAVATLGGLVDQGLAYNISSRDLPPPSVTVITAIGIIAASARMDHGLVSQGGSTDPTPLLADHCGSASIRMKAITAGSSPRLDQA